jgi:hypothetical protein
MRGFKSRIFLNWWVVLRIVFAVGLLIPLNSAAADSAGMSQPDFVKKFPANASVDQSLAMSLKWETVSGSIANYEYCIDTTDNDSCDGAWISTSLPGTAEVDLLPSTSYYWQVRASDDGDYVYSDHDQWWHFTTGDVSPYARRTDVSSDGSTSVHESSPSFGPLAPNLVIDGSFESSTFGNTTYWQQFSDNFLWVICVTADCGNGGGTAGPRSGAAWAWFGGTDFSETAEIYQNVILPSCSSPVMLQFYLWIGAADSGSDANDLLQARIDGTPVFTANATQISSYHTYTQVNVDISSYADGASHSVEFYSSTDDQLVNFNIDDVSVMAGGTRCTISGNAGTSNVTLNYVDVTPKTATSAADGSYSFSVPYNWSGTVTPSHPCFTFNPTELVYGNVITNQTGQDYAVTFDGTTGCADIRVDINGVTHGVYGLPDQGSYRVNYVGVDSGPVKVISDNAVPIIAAIREAWQVNGVTTSFSQLMGLPLQQASDTYVFPAYNNVTLNEQLRIGNVDSVATQVTVTIGGVLRGTYDLDPDEAVRINYDGLDSGPVVVEGTDGVNIISAIREAWQVNGQTRSFVQIMGLPAGQLSDKYVFPAYNNVTLNEQLRIGNVDTVETQVTVTIGGVLRGTYDLDPAEAVRINYNGLDSGPVIVDGTDGVNIISSIRDAWQINGVTTSFSQLMGMPAGSLSDTYIFPAYNNVTLNEQLRIGNVDTVATQVTVTIGGILRGTYDLDPDEAVRINYDGLDSGPVLVEGTDGVHIIAAIREAWQTNGVTQSFVQLMGLPYEHLCLTYLFPAYNNVTLNEQLRFAVP